MGDIEDTVVRTGEPGSARELERALAQKTALLHEVDHRVKNNLQLISSLLQLQSRRVADESTRQTIRGILERVNAIGAVHRRLFQSGDVQRFDVADFVRDLAGDLAAAARRDDVQLKLDLDPAAVPASQAAPLALVVNELISNSLKHAFPEGRPGVIEVGIRTTPEGFDLTVADDGVGMAADGPKGFGATIVQLLGQQLKAKVRVEDAAPGVRTTLSLPADVLP